MDRRRFLRGAGVAIAAAVTVPEKSYGGRAIPSKIDSVHVQSLRCGMQNFYVRDQQVGGAVLADSALNQYYDARQMLDEADYREEVGRELMTIAGELAVCVGWLSYDAGNQRKARELYAEAFLLADQANDARLAVQAIEKMVLQSAFIADRGRHRGAAREAARLGRRAVDLARFENSARLHALLGGRQAIAYAVAGDEGQFRSSITRAWREMDRASSPDDDATWLRFVNHSEIAVHEAKGYRYLGDWTTAAGLYRSSLEDSGLSPRNMLNYRAQLAATLAGLGDETAALTEGSAVLTAFEQAESPIASPRTLAELGPVRKLALLHGNDEFLDRYDIAEVAAAG